MKTLITLLVALTLGATLLAKDLTIKACTSDKKTVAISLTLVDEASETVIANVTKAYTTAASTLTAEEFLGREGFLAFVANLSDEDRGAITGLSGAPTVTEGTCR